MDFTLNLDIAKEITDAPEIVKKILKEKSMDVDDQKRTNTKSFLNWLISGALLVHGWLRKLQYSGHFYFFKVRKVGKVSFATTLRNRRGKPHRSSKSR